MNAGNETDIELRQTSKEITKRIGYNPDEHENDKEGMLWLTRINQAGDGGGLIIMDRFLYLTLRYGG